jgi:hypothetical protein
MNTIMKQVLLESCQRFIPSIPSYFKSYLTQFDPYFSPAA